MTAITAPDGVFDRVYAENQWGGPRGVPYSGCGSDIRFAVPYLDVITTRILGEDVVDLGCGDMRVGRYVAEVCAHYTGVDCVQAVITHNETERPWLDFRCLDIRLDPLPRGRVALLRQVLQHLSNEDVRLVLENCRRAGYESVFITDHVPDTVRAWNLDQPTGPGWRYTQRSALDLTRAPFNLDPSSVSVVLEQDHDGWGKLVTYRWDL